MKFALRSAVGVLALCSFTFGQDSLCSFEWNLNTDCNADVPCVEDTIDGATITVPDNVSRIARTGLELCLSDSLMAALIAGASWPRR